MTIYLYIKLHTKTGLKYFGKTVKNDPYVYLGSGLHWKPHIKKHGKEYVRTLRVWAFDDLTRCSEFALKFSSDNNIVISDAWANIIPENGMDGGSPKGRYRRRNTAEGNKNISDSLKGKPKGLCSMDTRLKFSNMRKGSGNTFYGKHHSDSTKEALRNANLGKTRPSESNLKASNTAKANKLKWYTDGTTSQLSSTPILGFRLGRAKVKGAEASFPTV